MRKVRLIASFLLAFAVVALPAIMADSAVVNFEPAAYAPGSVNGQNGWSCTGAYDQEVVALS